MEVGGSLRGIFPSGRLCQANRLTLRISEMAAMHMPPDNPLALHTSSCSSSLERRGLVPADSQEYLSPAGSTPGRCRTRQDSLDG